MLSVIIPTYNRSALIGKALKSVLDQTFTDLEIIVVDGSCNNDTGKEILLFNDDRIKHVKVENQSAAHSRNIGIKMARGELIAFNDDDDEWYPDKLEKQLEKLATSKSAKIVYSSFTKIINGTCRMIPNSSITTTDGNIYNQILFGNFIGLPTITLKRSCCEGVMFDEELRCLEDWDWLIRLAKRYSFEFVEEPLVTVKNTPKSVNKSAASVKAVAYKRIYEKYCKELKKKPLIEAKHLLSIGNNLCLSGNVGGGREYLFKSLKVDVKRPNTIISLLLSYLGSRFYGFAFKLYERLTCSSP